MNETKIAVALLTGLAAGAAIGMLFAPEPGTETRDKLTDSLTKLSESIRESASEQINHLAAILKEKLGDVVKEKFSGGNREEHADDLEHA